MKVRVGRPSGGVLVQRPADSAGGTMNTPISSMAAPACSNVILTNLASVDGKLVRIVSVGETVPLKPASAELNTCAYSRRSLLLSPSEYTSVRATAITNCPRRSSSTEPGLPFWRLTVLIAVTCPRSILIQLYGLSLTQLAPARPSFTNEALCTPLSPGRASLDTAGCAVPLPESARSPYGVNSPYGQPGAGSSGRQMVSAISPVAAI